MSTTSAEKLLKEIKENMKSEKYTKVEICEGCFVWCPRPDKYDAIYNTVWEGEENGEVVFFLMSSDIDELIAVCNLTYPSTPEEQEEDPRFRKLDARHEEMMSIWQRAFDLRSDDSIEVFIGYNRLTGRPYIRIEPSRSTKDMEKEHTEQAKAATEQVKATG